MASTVVAICNRAIGRIGSTAFISSIAGASNEARTCAQFYEPCRDLVLADFDWNFARKRSTLALLEVERTNWAYAYALPADCLAVRKVIVAGYRAPTRAQRIAYEIGITSSGQKALFCDAEDIEIEYTARIDNPNLFSQQFIDALADLIASEIASPLVSKPELGGNLYQRYEYKKAQGFAQSLNESQEDPEPDGEFITGRN